MTTETTITPELLDQLLANYEKPEYLTGADGLFKQLKKALIERALEAGPNWDACTGLGSPIAPQVIEAVDPGSSASKAIAAARKQVHILRK